MKGEKEKGMDGEMYSTQKFISLLVKFILLVDF